MLSLAQIFLTCMIASASSLLASAGPEQNVRIIGGVNATAGEFPFAVSLQMKSAFGEGYHFCGGIIIGDDATEVNLVLTAGHCIYGRNWTQIQVVAGAHNLSDPDEHTLQRRSVTLAEVHPDFDPVTLSNDFGALFVDPPFTLNSHVHYSPLHFSSSPPEYPENCTLIGWGSSLPSSPSPSSPQLLQKLNMTIVPHSTCQSIYNHLKPINSTTMICARGSNENKSQGPCNGDSGGPLICRETVSNRTVVAGIMSFSMIPCANPSYPSVFMDIQSLGWNSPPNKPIN